MKKKIALLLAAVMTVTALPMTAFASSDNKVSKVPTVENEKYFTTSIVIDEIDGLATAADLNQTVKITLTNAEWYDGTELSTRKMFPNAVGDTGYNADGDSDDNTALDSTDANVNYTKIAKNQAIVDITLTDGDTDTVADNPVKLTLHCKSKGEGEATITIEDIDSTISTQTLKIANVAAGATTTTISGTTSIREDATEIKSIVITETTPGTLKVGNHALLTAVNGDDIKLKLTNGFKWDDSVATLAGISVVSKPAGEITGGNFIVDTADKSVAYISLTGTASTTTAVTVALMGAKVIYDDSDVTTGDECEVTISKGGTTQESLIVGTATDYDVTLSVADKELPVFYAGRYDSDAKTLKVTIKEAIANSWLTNRKAKIVFPEGVEVVEVIDKKGTSGVAGVGNAALDDNEVVFTARPTFVSDKLEMEFRLSVSPEFTGDITATLTGAAVGEDQTVTVAKAEFPVVIDAEVNELKIDYRNTAASDIVITEAKPGVLGKNKLVSMYIDGISFDGDPTVEVESGDIKIKSVNVTPNGRLQFEIKTESQKEAGVIRITDVELYMSRSLPAGEYDLVIDGATDYTTPGGTHNAIIDNYNNTDDPQGLFDVDEVTALKGYVTVVTAGREQDDATFTTKVTVSIGADKMLAGTKEIALDVPAYIANGYTMLPVRAVTEALSGAAIVRWDDATKTVTITFGQRVINMTVGSRTMVINGVNVAMQAACEITDSRAFIPLRDLGYALGLNDSKIAWDDATKTATLN